MISSRALGERVAAARKAAGRTQAQLAERLEMARTTVVAVEKGERRPSDGELVRLAEDLGVTLHQLLSPHRVDAEAAPRWRLPPELDSPELRQAVELLRTSAARFVELERILGIHRPPAPLEGLTTAWTGELSLAPGLAGEHAAGTVRNFLGLGGGPAPALDEIFETAAGLRVYHLDELPETVAGLLVWGEEIGGCLAVQPRHPPARRRWSLACGLGRFLRDRERGDVLASDDWPPASTPTGRRRDGGAAFAESFATALLLPSASVAQRFVDRCRANGGTFAVPDVLALARFYGSPATVLARRLEELSLLRQGTWERLTARSSAPSAPVGRVASGEGSRPERWPRRYLFLAVSAYERELITESQLATYLEIDRVSARALHQRWGRQDLGEGFEVDLDLAENFLAVA